MTSLNKVAFNANSLKFKLSWKNISVWLKKKNNSLFWSLFQRDEYVKVLNNVSGAIYSGSLTAIIGISGSGKTTLLTTICQRTDGIVIGEILLNNKPISKEQMKNISGLLPQRELITEYLTVTEHMQLIARLKMHVSTSEMKRNQTIFLILSRLGLIRHSETKLSFLSGGEIKKLSLAEQLITDPPLLFCDELTTGLDSYNAKNVVKVLHEIATFGKAVVCTIHQPTYEIFEIFDQVTFLVKGTMVYHGPSNNLITYFNSLGLNSPNCYNPVEFFVSYLGKNQNNAVFVQNIFDSFQKSIYFKDIKKYNNVHCQNDNGVKNKHLLLNNDNNLLKSAFFVQLYWLLWRNYKKMKHDYKNIILRFILYMFIAILLSLMFWKIDSTKEFNQKDIQNLEGLIFLVITETIFTFTYSVLHTFPSEISKLLREISDGLYNPGPYYVSKIISVIPLILIETFCYCTLIFCTTGLSGFIKFYLPVLFCALSSTAYGFALSTTFDSIATASLFSVPLEFLGMAYSGIYVNLKNLSWLTFWLPYISQFYYGTESISVEQWKSIDALGKVAIFTVIEVKNSKYWAVSFFLLRALSNFCENLDLPCVESGKMVLEKYGFHENKYVLDLFALFVYCIVCHVIGFLSFKRKCNKIASY